MVNRFEDEYRIMLKGLDVHDVDRYRVLEMDHESVYQGEAGLLESRCQLCPGLRSPVVIGKDQPAVRAFQDAVRFFPYLSDDRSEFVLVRRSLCNGRTARDVLPLHFVGKETLQPAAEEV